MDIRTANVAMEAYTIILLGVLMLSQLLRRKRARESHLFFWLMFVYAMAVGGDLFAWIWSDADSPLAIFFQKAGNFTAYLAGFAAYPLYASYLHTMIRQRYRMDARSGIWVRLILGISGLGIALTLSNPWTHVFYRIGEDGSWLGGPFVLFHDIAAALEMLLVMISIWLIREVELGSKLRAMAFSSLPILGTLADFVERELTLIYPLTAFSFLFCYVNFQLRLEQEKFRTESDLAQARSDFLLGQVKPHLVFNTLNTIYHLCGKDAKVAQWAVGEFSEFLRDNIDGVAFRQPIGISRELEYVNHYIHLEKLRFGDRIRFEFDIRSEDFLIPPMTVQPLVENAVTHGVSKKEEGGCVTIRTLETDESYQVVVEDDGAGCDVRKLEEDIHRESPSETDAAGNGQPQSRPRVGIGNTRERLALYKGSQLVLESRPEGGFRAIIIIPKKSVEKSKSV
ncbi:MAG: histidine kinase [Lachnospiraceae bacterium]|nr:histidine kinase [Lachnospiraceae bacterium]